MNGPFWARFFYFIYSSQYQKKITGQHEINHSIIDNYIIIITIANYLFQLCTPCSYVFLKILKIKVKMTSFSIQEFSTQTSDLAYPKIFFCTRLFTNLHCQGISVNIIYIHSWVVWKKIAYFFYSLNNFFYKTLRGAIIAKYLCSKTILVNAKILLSYKISIFAFTRIVLEQRYLFCKIK